MRNQVAWSYEHEDAYQQRGNVQGDDSKPVKLYRNGTYIIGLCIEFDDACKVLEGCALVIGERIQIPILDNAILNIRVKTWY